jgi:16S rRNA (cytidine1402-2'-O)-methyltransferase
MTKGRLVLVATPIGNLGDLSPRALELLGAADLICCEDTRRTRALLSAKGLPAGARLLSLHEHNERERTEQVLAALAAGSLVAVVSDAGTPGISDPGEHLVAAAVAAGLEVSTVPGPSAVLAALSVSGLPTDRFVMEGFLPRKGTARAERIAALVHEPRTSVILESPRRVTTTLAELADALGADRSASVVRELTKIHEEVLRGSLGDLVERLGTDEVRGEVVVVLAGAPLEPAAQVSDEQILAALDRVRGEGASLRDAASMVAEALGIPRRRAYELALGA